MMATEMIAYRPILKMMSVMNMMVAIVLYASLITAITVDKIVTYSDSHLKIWISFRKEIL